MLLRFTKIDDHRHALEVQVGGRTQRAELETRSTLVHDLTHLAVESCSEVAGGFFTALAGGATLAELATGACEGEGAALLQVERAVAVLQGLAKADEEPSELHARVSTALALQGETPPPWFTPELVASVRVRLRELLGRWRATPYGATLEVGFTRTEAGT